MSVSEEIKKIAVVGGGNIGTHFACVCAAKGYRVTVFSSKPEKFGHTLTVLDSNDQIKCQAKISNATDSIETAMKADVIFVTYPAFMFQILSDMMEPYIRKGVILCFVPGTGGAEFAFQNCIKKGVVLCGLQRVPAVARLKEYGDSVCVEGMRDTLHIASIPNDYSEMLSGFMANLFEIPCYPLPNYLSVTMTPSNPILHTSRLSTMFEDYKLGVVYENNPLFYGEWSNASSQRLLECDAEHQYMLGMLPEMDLSYVKSLIVHYDGSDTPEKMTRKIRSIKSLNLLRSPMKRSGYGFVPDFESRYFTADFPFGLSIIEEMGNILGADIPAIKRTMQWYRCITGDIRKFDLRKYGINSEKDIYSYYKN